VDQYAVFFEIQFQKYWLVNESTIKLTDCGLSILLLSVVMVLFSLVLRSVLVQVYFLIREYRNFVTLISVISALYR
jgi:hypothetical protein